MTLDFDLAAQVTIGSHDVSAWVMSIQRQSTICDAGSSFTLELTVDMPYTDIVPNNIVTIYEMGKRVLNGFVTSIVYSRTPHAFIKIVGMDKFKAAKDCFIDDADELEAKGESVNTWMEILSERAGLIYKSDSAKFDSIYVAPGTKFGLMFVADAMNIITSYANAYLFVDDGGALHMHRGPLTGIGPMRFMGDVGAASSGSYAPTSGSVIDASWEYSDKNTRNVAKVFGNAWDGSFSIEAVERANLDLPTDKTSVYASPLLQTYESANGMAINMMKALGHFTSIKRLTVLGNPEIKLGRSAIWDLNFGSTTGSGLGMITQIESRMDEKGYTQVVTVDDNCPKLAGFALGGDFSVLWLAATSQGNNDDPRPWKLCWATSILIGAEPGWNIVDVPEGWMNGMNVARDNSVVYLIMSDANATSPSVAPNPNNNKIGISTLYYSTNAMNEHPDWIKILTSADALDATYFVDNGTNTIAFGSMQVIGKTLYVGVRGKNSTGQDLAMFYLEITGGTITKTVRFIQKKPFMGPLVSKEIVCTYLNTAFTLGYGDEKTIGFPTLFSSAEGATGGFMPGNGVQPHIQFTNVDTITRGIQGIWVSDVVGDTKYTHSSRSSLAPVSNRRVMQNGVQRINNITVVDDLSWVTPRGDYNGTQVQFVGAKAFQPGSTQVRLGDLYLSPDGGSYTNKFEWLAGIVICASKSDPLQLLWFPYIQVNANEIARYSSDGGTTWTNVTGNWWGSKGEVAQRQKMQSASYFNLIDVHPTFTTSS